MLDYDPVSEFEYNEVNLKKLSLLHDGIYTLINDIIFIREVDENCEPYSGAGDLLKQAFLSKIATIGKKKYKLAIFHYNSKIVMETMANHYAKIMDLNLYRIITTYNLPNRFYYKLANDEVIKGMIQSIVQEPITNTEYVVGAKYFTTQEKYVFNGYTNLHTNLISYNYLSGFSYKNVFYADLVALLTNDGISPSQWIDVYHYKCKFLDALNLLRKTTKPEAMSTNKSFLKRLFGNW